MKDGQTAADKKSIISIVFLKSVCALIAITGCREVKHNLLKASFYLLFMAGRVNDNDLIKTF